MTKAVLFLTFNRLDYTKEVFKQIQNAKPPRFYIASDGARADKEGEREKVQEVRDYILANIDWDCEVKTLFRDKNLGCGRGVSSAVTWFFENEKDGIILEDDCVPNQSFFRFCEELLDKYKDDKRVWHIAGNAVYEDLNAKETYYFAKIQHCWGWASWADRWAYYKFNLDSYDEKYIKNFSEKKEVRAYWLDILNKMKKHEIDTWDYQWTLWIVAHRGYCINPYKNLINNIGNVGVHYQGNDDLRLNRQTYEIVKITHPHTISYNNYIIDWIYRHEYNIKKPTMLYIRHSYHSKTQSNNFLIDILKPYYEIIIYDICPYTQNNATMLKKLPINNVEVLLLFQLPINGEMLKKHINFKKGVFFPMYDGAPARTDKIWLSWKDFNIINFSKTLHNELISMGLCSFYIQYFPKPANPNIFLGDEKSVFFWQRITSLNINLFKNIFESLSIKNIHIHKALDPNNSFVKPMLTNYNIEYSTWYNNKSDMLNDMMKSSIYIAPRPYEGIGMSFLEAMAMGRCVISPNHSTMNEYIEDGVNGILYDLDNPILFKKYNIKKIQQNTIAYIDKGYKIWEKDKTKILEYINAPVKIDNFLLIKTWGSKRNLTFLQKIFSVKNHPDNIHKIITMLGICIKIKRGKKTQPKPTTKAMALKTTYKET